jgi:hypothetical protein
VLDRTSLGFESDTSVILTIEVEKSEVKDKRLCFEPKSSQLPQMSSMMTTAAQEVKGMTVALLKRPIQAENLERRFIALELRVENAGYACVPRGHQLRQIAGKADAVVVVFLGNGFKSNFELEWNQSAKVYFDSCGHIFSVQVLLAKPIHVRLSAAFFPEDLALFTSFLGIRSGRDLLSWATILPISICVEVFITRPTWSGRCARQNVARLRV